MEKNEERKHGKEGEFGELVFVACMFIGGGLGLAFGQAGVGWLLGMGIGFLLMGIIRTRRVEKAPITIGLPASTYRIILFMLGIFIIICGLALLYKQTVMLSHYLPGVALVIIGVIVLIASIGGRSKGSNEAP